MRLAFAIVLLAATSAAAQPASQPNASPCVDCGTVRSIRGVTKEIRPSEAQEETKPSGFVASIPLKGGKVAGKPEIGSSERIGKDAPTRVQTWEVVVLQDDGKYRVVVLAERPDLREGDKVRFDKGKLLRRE